MALNDLIKRALEGCDAQRPAQPICRRHVVGGEPGVELVQKPEAPLREGKRRAIRRRGARDFRQRNPAPVPRRFSIARARAAMVRASKSVRSGNSASSAARKRDATRSASSEWPPRSNKSSNTSIRSILSTACHACGHLFEFAARRDKSRARGSIGSPGARRAPADPPCRWP